ncbi:uncharacterized protein DKFZp434B061-like [Ammospiza caudacuta]|uniref:uncharacterized protein DKFZp434B061-like n=1 Tax=Ammospiza caudacuta TaxID=2857398 RepID=UPI00273934D5|nr:uncharacterized protein DKFZp434B061-like [Ammospiza caudacuta]
MDTPTWLGGHSLQLRQWAGSVVATPPALSHPRRGPGGAKPWRVFGASRTRSCWRSSRAGAGPWGPPANSTRRNSTNDPDSDRAPPEFGEGVRPRQPIVERPPNPSPTLMDHMDSPLRLEPRQPLRAPPGPPKIFAGPPEPPPGRFLPLRAQLVALGVIGGVLLGLLLLGGAPG